MLQLTVHAAIDTFLTVAEADLARDEVTNGLILGLALRLKYDPARFEHPPYLATVNDDGALMAAAVMTPPYGVVVYVADNAEPAPALRLIAANLIADGWPLPTVNGGAHLSRIFVEEWCALTGGAAELLLAMRVYELRAVTPPAPVEGSLHQAAPGDIDCVFDWCVAFRNEATPSDALPRRENVERSINDGSIYLWKVDGRPVSLAAKGRRTPRGTSIGPVYTPPEQRGRGYASACVAALSQLILDEGKEFCTLFTDLANPTSNSIYQKVGYRPVCDFVQYTLSM
jgi:predicted GNAT family acetyltransferase